MQYFVFFSLFIFPHLSLHSLGVLSLNVLDDRNTSVKVTEMLSLSRDHFRNRHVWAVPVLLFERNNPPHIIAMIKNTTQQGGLPLLPMIVQRSFSVALFPPTDDI